MIRTLTRIEVRNVGSNPTRDAISENIMIPLSKEQLKQRDVLRVGKWLKKKRLDSGLPRKTILEKTRIHGNSLTRYELGTQAIPAYMLVRLANVYQADLNELVSSR